MSMQGDLATLELADIIQNLEMHRRTGSLVVEAAGATSRIFFDAGVITLLGSSRRPNLLDDLVHAGWLDAQVLAKARKSRRNRERPLLPSLIKKGLFEAESVKEFAQARLTEDVCDFLAQERGSFDFTRGEPTHDVFDVEEQHLGLSLAAGPILFEAARRQDQGALLRVRIASDATHYVATTDTPPQEVECDQELAAEILVRLNGTRSVRELVRAFPDRRFAAFETLATLVTIGAVEASGPDELLDVARSEAEIRPERALAILRDGLKIAPQHPGLLDAIAILSTRLEENTCAADAHKVLAHLQLEQGESDGARDNLMRACSLKPDDPAIRERVLALANAEGRSEDIVQIGQELVELYTRLGMQGKAATVLERLVQVQPDSFTLRRKLATARADCGDAEVAVSELRRYGRELLSNSDDRGARRVQKEILAIVPKDKRARKTIQQIDNATFKRRRMQRKRLIRWAVTAGIALPLGLLLTQDIAARFAYARANRDVIELELIENRRYAIAIDLLSEVREEYPLTLTSGLSVRRHIALLAAKLVDDLDS